MMKSKSREEIKIMRHAGHIVALVHQEMKHVIEPGISTLELDKIAFDIIKSNKAIPTFLGYNGFPASICASVNEQVVHGIPSKDVILKEG
ncbi:M24 family metallopeptidase, partial [bacterium]|nr:M24 family metallopeptidase [bacterium]